MIGFGTALFSEDIELMMGHKASSSPPTRNNIRQKAACQAGERFGKLVAVAKYQRSTSAGRRWSWIFRCDCGKEVTRQITKLRNNPDASCYDCALGIVPLTSDQKSLVEEHFCYATRVINYFQRRWNYHDDVMVSAGYFALMVAAMRHDPASDVQFRRTAFYLIKKRMHREVNEYKRPESLSCDIIDMEPPVSVRVEQKLLVDNAYSRMNEQECAVMRLYCQGFSFEEIAVELQSGFGTIIRRYQSGLDAAQGKPIVERVGERAYRNTMKLPECPQQLTPQQQDLATKYMPMAKAMAKPYQIAYNRFRDEFESRSMLALTQAARAFDVERGVSFGSYARVWIANQMKNVLTEVSQWENSSQEFIEFAESPGALAVENDAEWLLSRLKQPHRDICRMRYVEGMQFKQIAKALDYSKNYVSLLHRESIEKLQSEQSILLGELEDRRLGMPKYMMARCRSCGSHENMPIGKFPICVHCFRLHQMGLGNRQLM